MGDLKTARRVDHGEEKSSIDYPEIKKVNVLLKWNAVEPWPDQESSVREQVNLMAGR